MSEPIIRRTWVKSEKYVGSSADVIERLKENGHNVSWYYKALAKKQKVQKVNQEAK